MAKAAKSRKPGKTGSKPGVGEKPRKAATAVSRADKAPGKAAKPAAAATLKAPPRPAVSLAGAKLVGAAGAKKAMVRPGEVSATIDVSREVAPVAAAKVEASPLRAVIEPPAAVEREGTPPALPVPIASFTF